MKGPENHTESISEALTEWKAKIKLLTDPPHITDNTAVYETVISPTPLGDIMSSVNASLVQLNVSFRFAFVTI